LVAAPGARRRVFYFAAVIRSQASGKKFRKGFPKQSQSSYSTKQNLSASWGNTELEGKIAQRDRISPARQVPSQLLWHDR